MRALEDLSSFTSLSCLMMILATDALRSCSTERVMIPVKIIKKLECGPMPNLMAALPNTGGALCSTPQSLVDAQYWSAVQQRCQDAKPVEICRGAANSPPNLSR